MAGEEKLLAANICYCYDSMNRLLEENNQGETESYQYDLCGNRLFHKTIDGEECYQYNNRNQLTHRSGADGSSSYTYNAQGNITAEMSQKGTTTYGYNLFNRQSRVEMAEDQTLESHYDGEGLRAVQNGKASTFYYFNGELLGEKQEEQANRRILGYGVAASEVSGKTGYHAYSLDEVRDVLSINSNGNKYVLNHDHDTAIKYGFTSPDDFSGVLQSHHGLQEKWAREN